MLSDDMKLWAAFVNFVECYGNIAGLDPDAATTEVVNLDMASVQFLGMAHRAIGIIRQSQGEMPETWGGFSSRVMS